MMKAAMRKQIKKGIPGQHVLLVGIELKRPNRNQRFCRGGTSSFQSGSVSMVGA